MRGKLIPHDGAGEHRFWRNYILELSNPFFVLQNRNRPTRKITQIQKNWFKVLLEAVRLGVQSVAWKLSSDIEFKVLVHRRQNSLKIH